MSHTQHTIDGAIERSRQYDEIVTVIVGDISSATTELIGSPDCIDYDYVDTRGPGGERLREIWDATHDDGSMDWRVHLLQRL